MFMKCVDEVHMVRKERLYYLLSQQIVNDFLSQGMAYAVLLEKGCILDDNLLKIRNRAVKMLDTHLIHKEPGDTDLDLYWWTAEQIDAFSQGSTKVQ
jgi:hypothetical protein